MLGPDTVQGVKELLMKRFECEQLESGTLLPSVRVPPKTSNWKMRKELGQQCPFLA